MTIQERRNEARNGGDGLAEVVAHKETRKLRARRRGGRSTLFGMGMFGLVGWALAVPVLVGLAAGLYIDDHFESGISWTLTLLFLGFVLGAINAWFWIDRESRGER